jgi:hypothetical protein
MRKALQGLSPLRRPGLPSALKQQVTAAAAAAQDSSGPPGSTGSSSSTAGLPGAARASSLLTPAGVSRPLTHASSRTNTALLCTPAAAAPAATACSRLGPAGAPGSAGCGLFGSGAGVCSSSSKPGVVGLCLQPVFRLAAPADGMWPSPAAARAAAGLSCGAAAGGSGISSHRLWLPEAEETAAEGETEEEQEPLGLGALCPRSLTDIDFLCLPGCHDSCDAAGEAGVCSVGGEADQQQQQGRVASVASAVLWAGVSLAVAAAGGAAACRHKPARPLVRALECLEGGTAAALRQARRSAAGRLMQARNQLGRSNSSGASSSDGSSGCAEGCSEAVSVHDAAGEVPEAQPALLT